MNSDMPLHPDGNAHHSMSNPWARLLYRRMSDVSQDSWCASWLSESEFELWEALHGSAPKSGLYTLSGEEVEELRLLSANAGGWIYTGPEREHQPRLVTFPEWEAIFAEWKNG